MTDPKTTRGARKLQAAVEAFGLGEAIAGARAIDVGASTGGFTATLLQRRAREVVAIEVGSDQLAEELRRDPRVTLHEHTDFRRAPLSLAEGPFDFFTVDVSFMAGRNVLRPLAFRLREGAQGVFLLKPQFELPKSEVRAGRVEPAERARALERFSEKARELGFEILATRDSEVAGGSGTVELLLHLRFRGRPAHLPKLGEKREKREARAPQAKKKPSRAAPSLRAFVVAAPGLEAVLGEELSALCASELPRAKVQVVEGGVELDGGLRAVMLANLWSRIATRVLLRIGEVSAREFAVLRRRLGALPLEQVLTVDWPVHVTASTHHCRLHHTRALAETVLLAASDRLGTPLRAQQQLVDAELSPEGLPGFTRLFLRGQDDRFVLSIDTSGVLLHQRGGRVAAGPAPLRESLAAGILRIARYDPAEPLLDAMCGTGTIALEAAGMAVRRAPGITRRFAFERFPGFDAGLLEQARSAARESERSALPAPILGVDRDARAIEAARRNAERAGLADQVRFERADVLRMPAPFPAGLLIANPPYGKRLGTSGQARTLYRALGQRLRAHFGGYRAALLLPRETPAPLLTRKPAQAFPLQNGGLRVKLVVFEPRGDPAAKIPSGWEGGCIRSEAGGSRREPGTRAARTD